MTKEEIQKLRDESPIGSIFDFTERLSPMLVKELRQGLRSPAFTSIFLVMQAILMLLILTSADKPQVATFIIFIIYSFAVCFIQPLRGINAISSEVKGDTIDLIALTKLTSWKIVFGKWIAIMGQTLIITVSILPYLILRYFLGGMQLFEELTIFYMLFITSCISTAVAVGLSALSSVVLRIIIGGGLTFGLGCYFAIGMLVMALNSLYGGFFGGSFMELETLLWSALAYTIVGLYGCWILLDFGASMISPISENRAIARRLSYLGITLLGTVVTVLTSFSSVHDLPEMIQVLMLCLLVPFFISTITEFPYITPRICHTFFNRPWLKPFRMFLYPGWASGFLFVAPLLFLHLVLTGIDFDEDFSAGIAICIGSLLFPAAVMSLFSSKVKNQLSFYLIALVASLVLFFVFALAAEMTDEGLAMLFFWNPPMHFYLLADHVFDEEAVLGLSIVMSIVYSIIILVRASSGFSHIKQQEAIALQAREESESLEN